MFGACLSLLSELAELRPVLCLIDDAHWLDEASADALRFVARRLDAEGVVMLFAVREGETQSFKDHGLPTLLLDGLDEEAAAALLARAGHADAAPLVRDRLFDQTRGNALALVELPAALSREQLAGTEPLPEALPMTRQLEAVFLQQVQRVPEETRKLLLVAAADDSEDLGLVLRAAAGLGVGAVALDPAERTGLVTVRGRRLEFRHPLVRSAIYDAATSGERRAAHLSLADALVGAGESDRSAWHRAAVAPGHDDELAEELEHAAERARLRSAYAAASSAFERAAELTADDGPRGRRLVASATAAWHAGQPERATTLAERALPVVSDPGARAELEHLRGEIQFRCGTMSAACASLAEGAVHIAPANPHKALDMLLDAANAGVDSGDYAGVADVCQRVAQLPLNDDAGLRLRADLLIGVGRLVEGKSASEVPMVADVLARADELDEPRLLIWAAVGAGAIGELERETALFRRASDLARASGSVDSLVRVLQSLAVEGALGGRYDVLAETTEGLRLARDARLQNPEALFLAVLAWFAALEGRDEDCRAFAADATNEAKVRGLGLANALAEWSLGLLDLAGGRVEDAVQHLATVRTAPSTLTHAYVLLVSTPDYVEAAVRSGLLEEARTAFETFSGFAGDDAPAWARALAARSRALLRDGEEAESAFENALRLHAAQERVFDRARTELLFGEQLRRARRRVEAREHLRAAIDGFERLRAGHWSERAQAELRASGETARKRDPSTASQLTPQELQVARFVAEGRSNKEVAAQLFLSPRTIDAHLRSVFAKLGITSRTQLARLHAQTDGALSDVAVATVPT